MPSPQALVAFVTTLFLMLVATRVAVPLPPIVCAGVSFVLALAVGVMVERRVPHEDDRDADEVTEEAEPRSVARD